LEEKRVKLIEMAVQAVEHFVVILKIQGFFFFFGSVFVFLVSFIFLTIESYTMRVLVVDLFVSDLEVVMVG
jgi:hypothetical protein